MDKKTWAQMIKVFKFERKPLDKMEKSPFCPGQK